MHSSPVISLHAKSGVPPVATYRRQVLCHHYHHISSLPPSHPFSVLGAPLGLDHHTRVWLHGAQQPLLMQALLLHTIFNLSPPPPQSITSHSPVPSWIDISHILALHITGLHHASYNTLIAIHFLQLH
ncbi:hypothetical protein E2C01_038698 [Portunus trituberculatus]|uniref:Uncharacterized protein n=1 Tax=Portunus trituberculatus TaxID=210409 RepID=A0A5B7FHG9_PORTR|nr:hypothetical protein [Portunus trituberculatus]